MEFNKVLSKSIEKGDRVWEEKNRIEKKLKKGNLSEEKKKILEKEKNILEKKLKKTQNDIYL